MSIGLLWVCFNSIGILLCIDHYYLVLHPQMKLKYFQQHNWSKVWIDTAKEIVREEFAKYKVPRAAASVCYFYRLLWALTNIFNSIQTDSGDDRDVTAIDFFDIPMDDIQEVDELDEYLSQVIEKVKDPIAWWWDHRKVYPQLSAMALDYLSIPGKRSIYFEFDYSPNIILATSTAVERVFSQGRQLLYFTRNRLSPAMIRASLCFGDWSRKDLICMSDIISAVSGKGKGKRALEEDLSDNED